MFDNENKMGGLSLLYDSPSIDSVLKWAKSYYKDNKLSITSPKDGARFFISESSKGTYQYSSFVIQENKRYKIYG